MIYDVDVEDLIEFRNLSQESALTILFVFVLYFKLIHLQDQVSFEMDPGFDDLYLVDLLVFVSII